MPDPSEITTVTSVLALMLLDGVTVIVSPEVVTAFAVALLTVTSVLGMDPGTLVPDGKIIVILSDPPVKAPPEPVLKTTEY